MPTFTAVEARTHLGQLLDIAQREPVSITRHGQVAAFMVSPQDMQDMQDARRERQPASDAFETYFAKADLTLTPAARSLTDAQLIKLVKGSA